MPTIEKKDGAAESQETEPDTQLGTVHDLQSLGALGYQGELRRNRSMFTLLFQSLAIAAVPYGFGGPLISAILGGGQLPMFLGWIVVLILDEAVALSLGELVSKYPTSAGPYYWAFQLASARYRTMLSFITGCTWLIGNWTITLSVNFGFASLIVATVAIYSPEYALNVTTWQLLLVFYAVTLCTFIIVAYGNRILPLVDTICAAFTILTIFVVMVALSVKAEAGRASPSTTLGGYDSTLSGWGDFSFFIGILPGAYTFSAIGMISSMAEECGDAAVKLPKAMSLCVPVGGLSGLFFIIPICATMPALSDIISNSPVSQALPYIFTAVMGSQGGGLGLIILVLIVTLFCSISITVAASRCTWAFARDNAIPLSSLWAKVDTRHGTPIWALTLTTIVQMLLGLINLGSSSAFLAFVSVGVMSLAASYGIPIATSMLHMRREVSTAPWKMNSILGWSANIVALCWICFEIVLFSMPTVLPVNTTSMNYAIVVFAGFMVLSAAWYWARARKVYRGPPKSDGLTVES